MTEDTITVTNSVRRESCRDCRKYDAGSSTCRALPPGRTGWPATKSEEWCAAFARVGAAVVGKPMILSDQQILAVVDVDPRLGTIVDALVAKGMGVSSAYSRIRRLCATGRLSRTKDDGVVYISIVGGAENPAATQPIGRPRLHDPAAIMSAIGSAAPAADRRIGYNALYRAVRAAHTIGKGTFAKIIGEGLATGSIAKADDGRYYAVPKPVTSPPAAD